MDKNIISPYIRRAIHSILRAPFVIERRALYDYEIIFVKGGKCLITIDGKDYICKKNHAVFLRPGVPHSFHSIDDTDFVQPHIHFDAVYSPKSEITPVSYKAAENMSEEEISLIQHDVFADIPIPPVFTPADTNIFYERLLDVINTSESAVLSRNSALLKLLEVIINQFENKKDTKNDFAGRLPHSIKSYIDGNFYNILTLDSIANIFGMNKYTMMRHFKAAFGKNIIEYYNEKRLEAAKELLKNSDMPAKAVGEQLHFTDLYSFSRFFKQHEGVSPNKYRK